MYQRLAALVGLMLLCVIAAHAETSRYRIDSAASDIHWRIYRTGALSAAGHNHVISASNISGSVRLASAPQVSQFELEIPVAALLVDSPALRRRYGREFATQPSAQAVADTRANMLGEAVLNSPRFPSIHIQGHSVIKHDGNTAIPVTLTLAGRSISLRLPARITVNGNILRAQGDFTLSHRQLGLKPFRAALGTLRVAENIDFHFDIRARRSN